MVRWVGIDEAGYGPNLGPLVMTAVVAESIDDREPDLWADCEGVACRAGGPPEQIWVDDSKRILATRKGRAQLERACFSAIAGTGLEMPDRLDRLFRAVGAGDLDTIELARWLGPAGLPQWRVGPVPGLLGPGWKLTGIRSVVVGPARFNDRLRAVDSKAVVHFEAFAELLRDAWGRASDGQPTRIRGDKHGGRNFYAGPLADALPDGWVAPEIEGADQSRYAIRGAGRDLRVEFQPRADSADGLVALASIVSKALREQWMDAFNRFWAGHLPELKPSAGYPVDARRFRAEVGPTADRLGLHPSIWWRER